MAELLFQGNEIDLVGAYIDPLNLAEVSMLK